MISQLQIEKRNLESSILFMQQEHSKTLKALHEEISTLQKKCTDLNFKLMMTPEELTNCDELSKRIEELEVSLKKEQDSRQNLEKELATRNSSVETLRDCFTKKQKSYIEELKQRNQKINILQAELESKSGNIAYLTTEMHKLKVIQSKVDNERPKGSPSSRESSAKKKLRASDISIRPVTAKGTHGPVPDTEVFLAKVPICEPEVVEVKVKPTPPVLPPITGRETVSKSTSRRHQLIRRRQTPSTSEVTTLAVDSVASNSSTRINEPHTTSD